MTSTPRVNHVKVTLACEHCHNSSTSNVRGQDVGGHSERYYERHSKCAPLPQVVATKVTPSSEEVAQRLTRFERELCSLINRNSMESGSDTPDFILAHYLTICLATFDVAVLEREAWYARATREADPPSPPPPSTSILRCAEHGGHGFKRDCVVCRGLELT